MSEQKSEHQDGCCSSGPSKGGCGCGCGCGGNNGFKKMLVGLFVGAFIFASGMWFAKANCSKHSDCMMKSGEGKMCPMSMSGKMMDSK